MKPNKPGWDQLRKGKKMLREEREELQGLDEVEQERLESMELEAQDIKEEMER